MAWAQIANNQIESAKISILKALAMPVKFPEIVALLRLLEFSNIDLK